MCLLIEASGRTIASARALGARLSGDNRRRKRVHVARRGLGCDKKFIRYNKIEPLILTYCKRLDAAEILPGNEQRLSALSELSHQIEAREGESGQLEARYESVFDSFQNTKSAQLRADLEKRLAENLARRTNLKRDRAKLQA